MTAPAADPSPSSADDALIERCIYALEAGDRAAVDAILAEHPDRAAALRQKLDELARLGLLTAPSGPRMPERLGEFRLIRQLGRGGMGVVYLAEQESLRRNVALKLVHPEHLWFPGARERFRREVLAVARLSHPGIVPVYTFGESEGVPFYAMERLLGASLAEVLHRLQGHDPAQLDGGSLRAALAAVLADKGETADVPDGPRFRGPWVRVCCELVRDAATALQHAHEQKVLHRDLKPSNLFLTTAGTVHLIDFGLATAQGEQRITRTGATLGSLPYMAPEQVRSESDRIDARTDVYALGVTLYELLTLTLPHGDGTGSTRERILQGRFEPPTRRNPMVHGDAEAICVQAMDVDRDRRYPTAAALADDLQRFLELRPVAARRPGPVLHARRWVRRHPWRAAALGLLFVLLIPAPLLVAVQQNLAARRIRDALEQANEQRLRAETNLDQALLAVDTMLRRTAEGRLGRVPRAAALRRQLLEDALAFHETLAGSSAGHIRTREERARSQRRVGQIRLQLGSAQDALAVLQPCIEELELLLPESDRPDVMRSELARAHGHLADALRRLGRRTEQRAALAACQSHWQTLMQQFPDDAQLRLEWHDARTHLALSLGEDGRIDEALAVLDDLEERTTGEAPRELSDDQRERWLLDWAQLPDLRAVLHAQQGDTAAVLVDLELAGQRLARAREHLPDSSRVQETEASIQERLAQVAHQRREWLRAEPLLDQAIASFEDLLAHEPEVSEWRARLAGLLGTRANNRTFLDRLDQAEADHVRAIELLEDLTAREPEAIHHLGRLAIAYGERAAWRARRNQIADAEADLKRAAERLQQVLALDPDNGQAAANLVATLANTAHLLRQAGDLPGAREVAARALERVRQRTYGEAARSQIEVLALNADLAMMAGDTGPGGEMLAEAHRLAREWLAGKPEDPLRQGTLALIAANLGTMHLQLGQHADAITAWTEVLPVARQAAASGVLMHRQTLAVLLLRLCDVHVRDGELETAREWFRRAIAETGVGPRNIREFPPLQALFQRPDFQDLLPPRPGDR